MATVAAAGRLSRRRLTEPAHVLYAILGFEALVSVSMAYAFGFRPASVWNFSPQLYCVLLVASGPLARRIHLWRLGGSCETVGFLYGQGFAVAALLYPMTAIAAPFADDELAALDHLMRFDWVAFARLLRDRETMLVIMKAAYFSFAWQAVIIIPALFFSGRCRRVWILILAANFALVVTICAYPLAPAEGPFVHYGITPHDYPKMSAKIAWVSGPVIHAIRDNGTRVITKDLMIAFVSFPSYHAAAALLFAWAAWPLRYIGWPALLLNVAMTVSALIIGGHYLVDLLAGLLVGAVAIPLAKRVMLLDVMWDSNDTATV